jgi:hypothetical protein
MRDFKQVEYVGHRYNAPLVGWFVAQADGYDYITGTHLKSKVPNEIDLDDFVYDLKLAELPETTPDEPFIVEE